ncbi:MAG TPA: ketoacyl-ACP synthase III [Clostridiales bacterium]|nr:ketoacyl-ACP synthase III [Clostridiales bacterium]
MSFSIIGTGRCVPKYIMTNQEISTFVDTSDEWIQQRTGICERHICKEETITDLCVTAAKNALEDAGVTPQELDLIICATLRGELITPSEACIVQKELGATCPAFDINGACSGFMYALDVADGFFARNKVKNVLVIAADNLSNITDWTDRSTCVLFGDGSGAVVLSKGEGLRSINLTAKGNTDVLFAPRGENTSPFYKHPSERPVLHMNGPEVYKFAVTSMVRGIKKAIKDAGLTPDDIDHIIPHQANSRIIEAAAAKLPIPHEKYVFNIAHYGNTSASCMPMALDEANKAGKFKKGDYIAMCAFGSGLTTGSAVIRWDKD